MRNNNSKQKDERDRDRTSVLFLFLFLFCRTSSLTSWYLALGLVWRGLLQMEEVEDWTAKRAKGRKNSVGTRGRSRDRKETEKEKARDHSPSRQGGVGVVFKKKK